MTEKPTGYCSYAATKIDDEVMPLVKAAAALAGDVTVQEYISDALNSVASKALKRQPIKRRPPPPKPHGKGRPKSNP